MKPDISVIILTRDEEHHIKRAIESVSSLASEVIVVDSHSTDRTVEVARAAGAKVFQNAFINQAAQFAWALDNVRPSGQWIMRLDADEYIDRALANKIAQALPELPADVTGVNLNRRHMFLGRWIRHGGRHPLLILRLWRAGAAEMEERWMDEHMFLKHGRSIMIEGGFYDHNLGDLTHFVRKHNEYATREVISFIAMKYDLSDGEVRQSSNAPAQLLGKRLLRKEFYYRIPFPISTLLYFLYRYIFRLGFLDGMAGLIYHVLQGFWYRFLVGAKVYEFERQLNPGDGGAVILQKLSAFSGRDLSAWAEGGPGARVGTS
jgi:glycosyltransferase involved in cell wall biosynthesis